MIATSEPLDRNDARQCEKPQLSFSYLLFFCVLSVLSVLCASNMQDESLKRYITSATCCQDVVAALSEAGDTVLSLTVVHFCQCQEEELQKLHPLIVGPGDPLNLPSHIAQAEKGDLYLGDADAAATWLVLEELKISHVVNASQGPNHFADRLRYFSVDVADSPEEDLLSYVDDVVNFIHDALSTGENVLVHCHMGVSRSASLVIAWLGGTFLEKTSQYMW